MRVMEARELFRQITQEYFAGALVVPANQSRMPKPSQPLVTITTGNLRRPTTPNYALVDGESVAHYLSTLPFTVDLFTNGSPITDGETGETVAYEDNALDDILRYADFLNSEKVVEWSHLNDVSIVVDGQAQNMTGLVNDTLYQYRARLDVEFSFTQTAAGRAGVLEGLLYPTGDPKKPYTKTEPVQTESTTGGYETDYDRKIDEAVVDHDFEQTASGGGTQELAKENTGFSTSATIQEEKINE